MACPCPAPDGADRRLSAARGELAPLAREPPCGASALPGSRALLDARPDGVQGDPQGAGGHAARPVRSPAVQPHGMDGPGAARRAAQAVADVQASPPGPASPQLRAAQCADGAPPHPRHGAGGVPRSAAARSLAPARSSQAGCADPGARARVRPSLDPRPVRPRLARQDLVRIESRIARARRAANGSLGPDLLLIAITPVRTLTPRPVGTLPWLCGLGPVRTRTFLPVADQWNWP
jgi:hypothetical protein